jgi:hypothetical protein
MINTAHARLIGGVSGLALVMALGGVAHAGETMATAGGLPPRRPRPRPPRRKAPPPPTTTR